MYIYIENQYKELIENEIIGKKYIPCICSIKHDLFKISFQKGILNGIHLEVKDFDISLISLYAPVGAGGTWYLISPCLITLKKCSTENKLIFSDLGLYDHNAGWHWMHWNGTLTKDYCWEEEESELNTSNKDIEIYPLQ